MGQNNKYNNNKNLNNNNAGRGLGQQAGQRDSLKQQALENLSLSHSLSHQNQTGWDSKTPAIAGHDPNCPTVPLVPGFQGGTTHRIQAMNLCLHGERCPDLFAPGGCRPVCVEVGNFVFDLDRCPAGLWQKATGRI